MKHLVNIKNNIITEPDKDYTTFDGLYIQDFNKSEELMIKYGFDYELTDKEYETFKSGIGYEVKRNKFIDLTITNSFIAAKEAEQSMLQKAITNDNAKTFLNSTDWESVRFFEKEILPKIQTLVPELILSDDYKNLLDVRQQKRDEIVQ
jgi:hypothetical protein